MPREILIEKSEALPNLQIRGKKIYYKEIVQPSDFALLYQNEKSVFSFTCVIKTETLRPFVTFSAKDRTLAGIVPGDVVVIKICQENQEIEFTAKIHEWGKMHVPEAFVNLLGIKEHEAIRISIVARAQDLVIIDNGRLDIAKISSYDLQVKVIPRANDLITVYRKQKTPITLPRFIEASHELVELFFLIHGDGHYSEKLYFANKSPELHSFVMEEFENILRIPKNLWRPRVLLHDLANAVTAHDYWKNKLGLHDAQFYNSSKSVLNTDIVGNLRIILDKTIVSLIFRFIFDTLKFNLDQVNALHALNGLLAAEGGAQIGQKGLHRLTLSYGQKEKELFKKVLHKSGTLHLWKDVQNKMFVIESWSHLLAFFKIFLSEDIVPFRIHAERRKRAVEGFLKHRFTKTMVKYLTCIYQNKGITVKKLSLALRIREDSVLDTLRKSRYAKFVDISGKGINGNPFIISLKNEGNEFLQLISRLNACEQSFSASQL